MINLIKSINLAVKDFYFYLKDLNKKEFLVIFITTGFISGFLLGLISFLDRVISYGMEISLFNKLKLLVFSVSLLSFSGTVFALGELVVLIGVMYLFFGLTYLSKKNEEYTPYKILILYSLSGAGVVSYLFIYFLIENPGDLFVDLLRMNDIFISIFYILFFIVIALVAIMLVHMVRTSPKKEKTDSKLPVMNAVKAIVLIVVVLLALYYFFSIASNSWQIQQWMSESFFVTYNDFWVKFLTMYSSNLLLFKVNLFLTLSVVFLLINYLLVYVASKIFKYKQTLLYLSIFTAFLFVLLFLLTQNVFVNQLFIRFKITLVILLCAFGTYLMLHLTVFIATQYIRTIDKFSKIFNLTAKQWSIFFAGYIVLCLLAIFSFNTSDVVKAFVYRHNTFQKISLKWNKMFQGNKNLSLIPPKISSLKPQNELLPDKVVENQQNRPNVILIIIDAFRSDVAKNDLKNSDSFISDFAKTAYDFENAYSHTSYTVGSISSTFSSKFLASRADLDYITLPEILAANGYYTYCLNSFVKTFNFDFITLKQKKYDSVFVKGFEESEKVLIYNVKDKSQKDRLQTKMFIKFLEKYDKKEPLFIYLHFTELHTIQPSVVFNNLLNGNKFMETYLKTFKAEKKSMKGILEALKEKGIYDNSIIILTTDHGEEAKDHGDLFHVYTLYQELVHIPMFIKMPGQDFSKVVKTQVSSLDLAPTILDSLGIDYKNYNFDGHSFLPILEGKKYKAKPVITANYMYKYPIAFEYGLYGNDDSYQKRIFEVSIIDENNEWKFIQNKFFGYKELYNLKDDPQERNNLIDTHQQIAEQLLRKLQDTLSLKK